MASGNYLPKHALKQYHIKYNPKADELAKKEGFDNWWQLFLDKAHFGSPGMRMPVGSVTLCAWVPTKELPNGVVYERNPYYFKVDTAGNQLPYIDKILGLSYNENPETLKMQIITGQLDFDAELNLGDYPLLMENAEKAGYKVWTGENPRGSLCSFFFNQNYKGDPVIAELLRDARFRQAFSLAIDREEINEIMYLGKGVPRQSTVHPSVSFYEEKHGKAYAEYNPKRANQILDEMGLDKRDADGWRLRPDGKRLVIFMTTVVDMVERVKITQLAKEYWEEVGVKTEVEAISRSLFTPRVKAGEMMVHSWAQDGTLEPAVISSKASFYRGGMEWCVEWKVWWDTKGEKGEEPPAKLKRIFSLCEQLPYVSEEEKVKAGKEILDHFAEQVYFVGTVGMAPIPCIAKVDLGNINENVFPSTHTTGGPRNQWTDELFWKK